MGERRFLHVDTTTFDPVHFADCLFSTAEQDRPGSDRLSDESSKEAVSDSHAETVTDPEFSDPQMLTSSPPQSGDELRHREKVTKETTHSIWH